MGQRQTLAAVAVCFSLIGCASAPVRPKAVTFSPTASTAWSENPGFKLSEALALLEMCIALDYGKYYDNSYGGMPVAEPKDAAGWHLVFPDRNKHWSIPRLQPIGPYDNAWELYQRGSEQVFAIAIRGTIDSQPSAFEDVIATSMPARAQIEVEPDQILRFTLAETPGAETHLGFTYGMVAVMFDPRYGILPYLQNHRDEVHDGAKIYITGHSQGAAVATLVHAFLHYAIVVDDPAVENPNYSLRARRFKLKSYVFAQPKPGNWQFAMDFARIAGANGTAFVVNNDADWVPQVPLSIEFLDEPGKELALTRLETEVGIEGALNRVIGEPFLDLLQGIRGVNSVIGENLTLGKLRACFKKTPISPAYLEPGHVPGSKRRGISINYSPAGDVIPVFGSALRYDEIPSQVEAGDTMLQHHGTTYRFLLEQSETKGGPPSGALTR